MSRPLGTGRGRPYGKALSYPRSAGDMNAALGYGWGQDWGWDEAQGQGQGRGLDQGWHTAVLGSASDWSQACN